jgi:hypothetical protein
MQAATAAPVSSTPLLTLPTARLPLAPGTGTATHAGRDLPPLAGQSRSGAGPDL